MATEGLPDKTPEDQPSPDRRQLDWTGLGCGVFLVPGGAMLLAGSPNNVSWLIPAIIVSIGVVMILRSVWR